MGSEYPYFLSGKQLAEGYQKFVDQYGLNVKLSATVERAIWNEQERMWAIETCSSDGSTSIVVARHLVLAIVAGGQTPRFPHLTNTEVFKGIAMHSAEYTSTKEWSGLKGVVIGTANTGHDVTEDMLNAGLASATMVQRNPTPLMPISYYRSAFDPVYNDKIPTEKADRMRNCDPRSISRLLALGHMTRMAGEDAAYFEALDRVGFKNERVCDIFNVIYERLGGHYLDVGASAKVARGLIKVKSDAALTGFNHRGLSFSDGSTLDADVVVFATGFEGNMRTMAAKILNESVIE